MNLSLQAVVARVKTSRAALIALVCGLSVVAVLAMVMAFRGPAGQEFVGIWTIPDPVSNGFTTVHIYRTADGFALQGRDLNVAPVPYQLEHGELVPAPGYENCSIISMVGKKLVLTPPRTSAATPRPAVTPASTPTQAPRPVSTDQQDPNAQKNAAIVEGVHTIQVAVQSWAVDHQDLFPTVDVVVSAGAFAGYVQNWPTNPVTLQPMAPGTGAGDYTYEQIDGGRSFRLTGFGVDNSAIITVP